MADQTKSIFVRGLHSRITEEILWELFLQAGPLDNVRIPLDRESGKPRTFGFVTYQDACSVPYACELFNDLKLFGRPIICKPQNAGESSRNGNSSKEYQARSPSHVNSQSHNHINTQSPGHMNSSSDDELANRQRWNDIWRTPSLQFIGGDESPYGRSPLMNPMNSTGIHPLLQRTVSSDSVLAKAQMGLRMQALMGHSFQSRMSNRQSLDSPVFSRRGRYGHERRQLYESHDRGHRPKPY